MSNATGVHSFDIWIVAMSQAYAPQIAGALMKKGFSVSFLAGGGFSHDGSPASFITLTAVGEPKVGKDAKESDKKGSHVKMRAVVEEAIKSTGAYYYALIVSCDDGSTAWALGNIDIREIQKNIEEKRSLDEKKAIENEIDAAIYGPGGSKLSN